MNDELALQTRRLLSFSTLYSNLWDLYARQAEVRKVLVDMNEEFTQAVPKSRLVLYLKRKDSSFEYSALHWGFTIPGLKSWPVGADGHRARRIKHISTPLNDAVVHCGAGDARRKLFFDFDRRRLAANEAYKKVTKAITTIRQILKGRAGKGAAPTLETPLPPDGSLWGLPAEGLQTTSYGWRLLVAILEKEIELLRLAREVEVSKPDPRLQFVFRSESPEREQVDAHWVLEGAPIAKLTYAQIRALRIPEAHQRMLSRYERSRRDILKVLSALSLLLVKVMRLADPALVLADRGMAEARLRRVDRFGKSLVAEEKAG
jgi:hypothetical protein